MHQVQLSPAPPSLVSHNVALSTLYATLPGAAYQCTIEAPWAFSDISAGVEELTGYPPAAFLSGGLTWGAITHPDDLGSLAMAVKAALREHQPFSASYRIRCKNGEEKWVSERGKGVCDQAHEQTSIVGFIHDVTLQKRTVEKLREVQSHNKWLLEVTEHFSWTTDAVGRAIDVSDKFFESLGVSREDALSTIWTQALHPEDVQATIEDWTIAINSGAPLDQRFRLRQLTGEYRWYRAQGAPVRDATGRILKWQGTTQDINNQVEGELGLAALNARAVHHSHGHAMHIMAATLAHELNQPLAAAANYVEVSASLNDRFAGPNVARVGEGLKNAAEQIHRAGKIIHRVRALVRDEHPTLEITSTRALFDRTEMMFRATGSCPALAVSYTVGRGARRIAVDKIQIEQVLLNLLRNACEAMVHLASPVMEVSAEGHGERLVKITVSDAGCGLSEEARAGLFTAYGHSSSGGLGVGLSVSRTIVEAHGGRIWVESNPNVKTSFMFTVPIAAD